jgi:hypothetical protein
MNANVLSVNPAGRDRLGLVRPKAQTFAHYLSFGVPF